ncbi:MAG: STAS domain-containing protein [Chitinivibrionales bacterium]|nr:STAS domain-containing protein [Chitinivibrionales bacterium]
MKKAEYSLEHKGAQTIVHVNGDIRGSDIQAFCNIIEPLRTSHCESVLIDFTQVNFIESSTVGTLIHLKRTLEKAGKKMQLDLSEYVEKVFSHFGLRVVFDIIERKHSAK